ncbi:MAG: hypothetical protein H3Z52_05715, partial [archaeon]|nr:hypothetical protein [archaeon]
LPEEFWDWYSLGALFGDTPICRTIQFLSVHRGSDYTLKEIARQTHVGYRTFYRFIPRLIELEVIEINRRVRASKLYRLNEESPIVKAIQKLSLEISMKKAKEEIELPA